MSLLTELHCDVLKADCAILHDVQFAPKSVVYLTVQNNDTVALPIFMQDQYIVFTPIDSPTPVVVNTTIDTSASLIGDQLTIMASGLGANTTINFPATQMLFAQCGISTQPNSVLMTSTTPKVVLTFTFDGSQFVCGYDNC
jgi:hypothetical protein